MRQRKAPEQRKTPAPAGTHSVPTVGVRFLKAFYAVALAAIGLAFGHPALLVVWPLFVVYLMLAWKEYATYEPLFQKGQSRVRMLWRGTMFAAELAVYALLAASFPHPLRFAVLMSAFLLIETIGYAAELATHKDCVLLRRKMKMNIAGLLLALVVLVSVHLVYTQVLLIFWGILSTDITLYFLVFRNVGGEWCATPANF